MAASHISGPSIIWGDNGVGSSSGSNPDAGPSSTYQGDCIPDVRFPYTPGVTGRGVIRAFLDTPYIASVDAVPSANSATVIAAAQTGTSGTALTLASVAATGIGVNFPLVPANKSYVAANVVKVAVLDPGFCTISTTGGSAATTITASNYALFQAHFQPGMTHLIGDQTAAWTIARVLSVSGTTVTYDTAMTTTNSTAPVALANGQMRLDQTPVGSTPYLTAGAVAAFDPRSGLARGIQITTTGANTGGTVTIAGYDIFGFPMTETIACATASTFYGNKCFKYVVSATPAKTGGGAMTGNFSVGTSDLFGFNTRTDAWEYTNVFWAGSYMTSSTGWYAADTTNPATATTKDVRGVIQTSAKGPLGSGIGTTQSNGTNRLQLFVSTPLDNLFAGTATNPAAMFGVTQF